VGLGLGLVFLHLIRVLALCSMDLIQLAYGDSDVDRDADGEVAEEPIQVEITAIVGGPDLENMITSHPLLSPVNLQRDKLTNDG
jgi:hypothetical protein